MEQEIISVKELKLRMVAKIKEVYDNRTSENYDYKRMKLSTPIPISDGKKVLYIGEGQASNWCAISFGVFFDSLNRNDFEGFDITSIYDVETIYNALVLNK